MLDPTKMWSFLRTILRILQHPKVLMFLSVITIFFLLNRSKNPVVLKAHVDFKGIQRSVSFEKGDKVQELRYHIMVAFSDVGLDKLPPARVKLLKYDESVQDYVRLHLDSKLQENIRVKVELKEDKAKEKFARNLTLRTYNGLHGPELFHPVENYTLYRLWNPATTSLLQRDLNNMISCNGSFKDMDYDTVAKAIGSRGTGFAFLFEDKVRSKIYVLNVTNGGKGIVAVEFKSRRDLKSSMKFKPSYYWSFTVFENVQYKTLYLGCGNDGRSLLVPMNSTSYPDPRALFITNKYILDFSF